jgi:hypothetical protein
VFFFWTATARVGKIVRMPEQRPIKISAIVCRLIWLAYYPSLARSAFVERASSVPCSAPIFHNNRSALVARLRQFYSG